MGSRDTMFVRGARFEFYETSPIVHHTTASNQATISIYLKTEAL